jgi:23S rRNA pseudouridine2605 synthase
MLNTHTNVVKSYSITIRGFLSNEHVKEMLTGVPSPVGILSILSADVHSSRQRALICLNQGKNRHIRRLISSLRTTPPDPSKALAKEDRALKVLKLKRVSYGCIELGDLPPNSWRYATQRECDELLKLAGWTSHRML